MRQRRMGALFSGKMELHRQTVCTRDDEFDGRLAMMEMRVTIARLLWEFDVQLKDEGQEVPKYDHKSISAGQLDVRLNLVEK